MHSKYIKIYQQTTKSSSKYCVTFTQDERKEQWHIFTAVNWTVAQAGLVNKYRHVSIQDYDVHTCNIIRYTCSTAHFNNYVISQ